ncbi:CTLH/CRA C-terminal to lish motif domain-containing protein [Paraphysoderma sedebokerense]|nr:CTLH/CRA C-terminal to lish motif domain-containing protein [Paraphysoderma sedebokerense]
MMAKPAFDTTEIPDSDDKASLLRDMQSIILEYLTIEGFEETAKAISGYNTNVISLIENSGSVVPNSNVGNVEPMSLDTNPNPMASPGSMNGKNSNKRTLEINSATTSPTKPNSQSQMNVDNDGDLAMVDANECKKSVGSSPSKPLKKTKASHERIETLNGGIITLNGASEGGDFMHCTYQLQTLKARKHITNLILAGQIPETIAFLNTHFPNLLPSSPTSDPKSPSTTPPPSSSKSHTSIDILFRLHCQHFIELMRKGETVTALQFAQTELKQFISLNAKYLDHFSDVFALIAYPDPWSSPVASYLSEYVKEELAEMVNGFILGISNCPITFPFIH